MEILFSDSFGPTLCQQEKWSTNHVCTMFCPISAISDNTPLILNSNLLVYAIMPELERAKRMSHLAVAQILTLTVTLNPN